MINDVMYVVGVKVGENWYNNCTVGDHAQPGVEISYGYDKAGRRLSMTTPGLSLAYSYNELGQLTSLTDVERKREYDASQGRRDAEEGRRAYLEKRDPVWQ